MYTGLSLLVVWHYSRGSGHVPSYCRNFGKIFVWVMRYSHIYVHVCKEFIKIMLWCKFHDTWASPGLKLRGNRSVGRSGKVNPAFLYRNELDPDKQTITQESKGQELPGDQVMEKLMILSLRRTILRLRWASTWLHWLINVRCLQIEHYVSNCSLFICFAYNSVCLWICLCLLCLLPISNLLYFYCAILGKIKPCLGSDLFLLLLKCNHRIWCHFLYN